MTCKTHKLIFLRLQSCQKLRLQPSNQTLQGPPQASLKPQWATMPSVLPLYLQFFPLFCLNYAKPYNAIPSLHPILLADTRRHFRKLIFHWVLPLWFQENSAILLLRLFFILYMLIISFTSCLETCFFFSSSIICKLHPAEQTLV